ncbi:hypothetical protein CQ13_14140 [Bradyrhizobium retamae]|uniref:Uncharacterized protein n=1 Tax=Bradyrhizobium retamae TaxID=1300035 RepID=A0A0R3NC76_9BRAD|nr:hypothetical protein CQ13_14140 [Bradyrhizobium retamae]
MRQPGGGHRERQGDADAASSTRLSSICRSNSPACAKALALRRELRRVHAAVDQVETEPGLERFDPPAERGLGRVSFLGGAGEAALVLDSKCEVPCR